METQVKTKDGRKAIAKLPPLHEAQLKVTESDARWKILCAGRRFGKSRLGVQLC